jgi:hypothetical protein
MSLALHRISTTFPVLVAVELTTPVIYNDKTEYVLICFFYCQPLVHYERLSDDRCKLHLIVDRARRAARNWWFPIRSRRLRSIVKLANRALNRGSRYHHRASSASITYWMMEERWGWSVIVHNDSSSIFHMVKAAREVFPHLLGAKTREEEAPPVKSPIQTGRCIATLAASSVDPSGQGVPVSCSFCMAIRTPWWIARPSDAKSFKTD